MMNIVLAKLAAKSTISHDFLDNLQDIDGNHDGIITAKEVAAASAKKLAAIKDSAGNNQEWNIVRDMSLQKGTYVNAEGVEKGMAPGQGGRFDLMVESLTDRGYSPEVAQSIAAKIGRAKYAFMR